MKLLTIATIATIATIGGIAATASASCAKGPIAWTSINTCSAPNQNRGSAQGAGTLGTNTRVLSVQCTIGGGNIYARASGITSAGNPIATCKPQAPAGSFVSSAPGQCNGGFKHSLVIAF